MTDEERLIVIVESEIAASPAAPRNDNIGDYCVGAAVRLESNIVVVESGFQPALE